MALFEVGRCQWLRCCGRLVSDRGKTFEAILSPIDVGRRMQGVVEKEGTTTHSRLEGVRSERRGVGPVYKIPKLRSIHTTYLQRMSLGTSCPNQTRAVTIGHESSPLLPTLLVLSF